MKILKSVSLKPYNTFGIDVKADTFIEIQSEDELKEALSQFKNVFILGGGSNMLLTKAIDRPILHISIKGISIEKETDDFVWIKAKAGENWHEFVMYALAQGFGGLENLALIPGNVGTTPVQNIGAYGIEIKDMMESCEAIHRKTLQKKSFTNADCQFAYRESVFKNKEKDNYIITSVTFKLTKKNHRLHLNYGAIASVLEEKSLTNPKPKDVAEAVISIRQSKLPNPKELGNSGSFFKNPIVETSVYESLKKQHPEMPGYVVDENHVKIPAGWLIDHCGLKGYRKGDAGVHKNQALVLVNYGNATGADIWQLAKYIQQQIVEKYGVSLSAEVNVF